MKGTRKAVEGPLSFASATAGVTVVALVVAVPFSSKTTGVFFKESCGREGHGRQE